MNRKYFLLELTIAIVIALAVILARNSAFRQNSQSTLDSSPDQTITESLTQDCILTPQDSEGPYYIANVPFRDNLVPDDVVADMLVISGRVLLKDCVTPVANAILDIWHADENGYYQDKLYRGKVETSFDGSYDFTTVMPAPYGSGPAPRPRHIHYKVVKDSQELLTSQMYFDQELVSEVGQTRIVKLTKTEKELVGEFNIFVNELN